MLWGQPLLVWLSVMYLSWREFPGSSHKVTCVTLYSIRSVWGISSICPAVNQLTTSECLPLISLLSLRATASCSTLNARVKVPQYGDLSLMPTWVDLGSARRREFWAHPWGLFPSHLTEAGRPSLHVDGTIPWAEVWDWMKEEKGGRELRSGFITLLPD